MRVAWEGDFEALHSLAIVNRAVCRGLIDRGHDVRLMTRPTAPGGETPSLPTAYCLPPTLEALAAFDAQVHVRHHWPPMIEPPIRGKWVLMQPWEFGSLPKDWVPMLRQVDEVWAYSRSVRECYLEAEVSSEKVHVVPLGVAPKCFGRGLSRSR